MVDFVKLPINSPDSHELSRMQRRLRQHSALEFVATGKKGLYQAVWEGFTFEGDANRCWQIRGSFHKAHHDGTNWQNFTHGQFVEAGNNLCDTFGLHPASLRLAGLEIGVNIVPPIPTSDALRAVVMHKTKFTELMGGSTKGIKIMHGKNGRNYRFKLYDKAHQYGLPCELLRYEIAVRQMRTLAACTVRTLADLLEPSAWERLGAFLLARFDELLIVEPQMRTDALRPAQRTLVDNAPNPAYWQGMTRQRRSERRRALECLYDRHTSPRLRDTLRASIADKLNELTAVTCQEVA